MTDLKTAAGLEARRTMEWEKNGHRGQVAATPLGHRGTRGKQCTMGESLTPTPLLLTPLNVLRQRERRARGGGDTGRMLGPTLWTQGLWRRLIGCVASLLCIVRVIFGEEKETLGHK